MEKSSHKVLSRSRFSILETIGGIKFTSREIDILACILEGRSTKKIASFLCLSPKTIENYLHNIRLRLECSSREGIRDFLEKSDKVLSLKIHYSFLVFRAEFEQRLKDFSTTPEKKLVPYRIIYWPEEENYVPFISHLERYLKLAGMSTFIENPGKSGDLNSLIKELKEDSEKCTLYFLPKGLREGLANSDLLAHFETIEISEEKTKDLDHSLILLREGKKQRHIHIPKTVLLSSDEQFNTFLYLAEILNIVLPELHLEDLIKKLKQGLEKTNPSKTFQQSPKADRHESDGPQTTTISAWKQRKWNVSLLVALLFLICYGVYFTLPQSDKTKSFEASIRSDLVIPVQDAFLERSELITQLDEKFKGKNGIQTIALIGPGGAGKTTFARQYAHLQKANVIWEINAETQESLSSSFESLAQALAKTEEDKKILMQIRNLQIPSEKEDKIILFVKEHLRKQEHWFLVFDNVDSFTEIQKYFPCDVETWGQGKIVLTTRDSTLQSNKSVNNAIHIGELTSQQKLVLFTKVIKQENEEVAKPHQLEEVKQFLEKIPPYPLDVSVAAYYIKSTDTPYAAYLESLNSYHKDFITIQEWLLKENGDYLKTRYGIVSLSLQNLINTHKSFAELLLLISILDSQNIPIDLLKKYKGEHATDNFIYNLKKYSLITNNSQVSPRLIPTISIHRSTQAMVLAYLEKNLTLKKTQALVQGIVDTLVSYADTALEEQNLIMVKLLLNHYDRFLTYDSLLTDSSKNAIRRELAYMYFGFGDFIKTKNHLESGLMDLKEGYLKGDVMVARPLSYLGETYRGLGSPEKSKDVLENSLMLCKQHPTHQKELGRTLVYLGNTYRDLGNYNKAIEFLLQALAVLKQDLPKNNSAYAEALAYMGLAYWFSGDYVNHRYYLEKSVDLYKNYFPENQLLIGATCSHLANSYAELGFDEKARDLLEKSLDVLRSSNKTQEHGYALLLLGNVYRKLGNYQKAKPLIEEALIILKQVHPDNQVRLVEAFTYLGILNGETGDYKTAKDLLNQSLMLYEKKYGREHVQYGKVLGSLGEIYLREGDLNQAEDLLQKSLAILKKNKHTDAYLVLESLADLYLKKSKFEADKGNTQQSEGFKNQANIYLKQSLQIVHTRFPKDSPHIIRIQNKLKSLDEK